ncbi:PLDc N-terminal domain-containing protein [Pseudoflavonifractor sp. AF19-9AC]|uniref:PLDc N-terminal domain-containing protein n=1 Tax=Pseudoflavonifractor sp. AF19-9AC TaxID=2292244 RepID=UPI001FAA571F|nr:PLDc N-terminal domain-containing protein [Pseudoflavonifractor sp. AF19-9AC]
MLHVVSKRDKAAYKTAWVFLILLFPLFGGLLYLMFHVQGPTRSLAKKVRTVEAENAVQFALPGTGYDAAEKYVGELFPQVRYLQNTAGFPIYDHTSVQYFSPGERLFEALLPALEQAEHYIFLEFFIVQEGNMWDSILNILKKRSPKA